MKNVPINSPPQGPAADAPDPRFHQVAAEIRRHIARLPAGSPVPSTAHWRALFKVSRTTIIRAFAELKAEGVLRTRVGAGAVTGEPTRHRTVLVLWATAGGSNAHDGGIFLTGACRAAEQTGKVMVTHVPTSLIGEAWDPLHAYRDLSGVLFFRAPDLAARWGATLDGQGVPWLLYGSTAYGPRMAVDDGALTGLALGELARAGHRRIGMMVRKDHGPSRARLEAWKAWHWERNLPVSADMVFEDAGGETPDAAGLRSFASKVTAVFASTDGEAVRLMETLRPRGVRFPRDLSLIGVDNMHLTASLQPGLTTLEIPLMAHGARCLERLLGMDTAKAPSVETLSDFRLVRRGTVAPPRRSLALPHVV